MPLRDQNCDSFEKKIILVRGPCDRGQVKKFSRILGGTRELNEIVQYLHVHDYDCDDLESVDISGESVASSRECGGNGLDLVSIYYFVAFDSDSSPLSHNFVFF
jgi:hypothetical protein